MDRRNYLLAVGTLAALAGCTGRAGSNAPSDTPTSTGGGTPTSDVELPVPRDELRRGAPEDAIPAITEPAFAADWSGVEVKFQSQLGEARTVTPRLDPDDEVVGVERDGEARAYPLRVLNWHEVVNDGFAGPLLVTYCPLCGSAISAVRTVNGEETRFGVSGFLWMNDLVMYDALTDSLWSQIVATAINGTATGDTLELVPSTLTTWEQWQAAHEDTTVLLPPPESNTVNGREATRDYTQDPYSGYDTSGRIGIGGDFDDDRLHAKTEVVGIEHDGVARAYPIDVLETEQVVNDEVGGLPVVVALASETTLVAYERAVDGRVIEFGTAGPNEMAGGGSTWTISSGTAVGGPLEGTTLAPANDASPMFFFAWKDFNEDTEVYDADS